MKNLCCNSRKMFNYSNILEQIYKSNNNKLLGPGSICAKTLQQLKCDIVELLTDTYPIIQSRLGAKRIGSISWDISLEKILKLLWGNYISVSLIFYQAHLYKGYRIWRHLVTYDILEESPHSFFKARYAHEYMSVSEGANMLSVKLISLTEYIWIHKNFLSQSLPKLSRHKKTWSVNRKETMG